RGGDELADKDLSPFSVAGLLISVQDMVRPIAEEKGLTILVAPPQLDDRLGYPAALSRALLNLTTNALKFTDRGSVTVSCDAPPAVSHSSLVRVARRWQRAPRLPEPLRLSRYRPGIKATTRPRTRPA